MPLSNAPTTATADSPSLSAAGSSTSVWWVGASSTDSSALPNTGVRGTFQVISTTVTGCLSFWASDDSAAGVWGQVGYYICDGSTPIAFYQIWNLTSNLVIGGGSVPVVVGIHSFGMYLASGNTWAYTLDGSSMGAFDMGAATSTSSYPVYALSEEQGTNTFSFPAVTFSTAMQVMQGGSWVPVQAAVSYGNGWGVEGQVQNSSLGPNEFIVGGSVPTLAAGTTLWGASSTGTSSTTNTSPTTSNQTSTVAANSTVTPPTQSETATSTFTTTLTIASTTTETVTTGLGASASSSNSTATSVPPTTTVTVTSYSVVTSVQQVTVTATMTTTTLQCVSGPAQEQVACPSITNTGSSVWSRIPLLLLQPPILILASVAALGLVLFLARRELTHTK